MRTNYSRQRRPGGLKFSVSLVLIAVLLVVAVLWRGPLQTLLWRAASPLGAVRDALMGDEVLTLKAQLASTTAALADRNALNQENIDLKARLGRDASKPRVLASILMRPPASAYDTLIIDAGEGSRVAAGDLVYAAGNLAIGEVSEVNARDARVSLFSSPGTTWPASIEGPGGQSVSLLVVGQGGGSFVAEVPAGVQVKVGDPVVFGGIASPLLAEISGVDQSPGASFMHLYLHVPVDFFNLRWVEVATQ